VVRVDSPVLFRRATLASVAANVLIVITGGVVRLSDSGLGCPTWPRCTAASYVTTHATGFHGAIEFGNRLLTYVLVALAVLAFALAVHPANRTRRRVRLAGGVLATIPAQAVLGGLTVLTHLNPWLVAAHFLLSMGVIALGYRLYLAAVQHSEPDRSTVPAALVVLARVVVTVTLAVLAAGTVVTGSGPHAGDQHSARTGLDPQAVAQLHTDLVMLLIGLSVAFWLGLRAVPADHRAVSAARLLVAVELAQGVIGLVQYVTHLPPLLVGLHMAGACAVWLAALAIFPAFRPAERGRPGADGPGSRRTWTAPYVHVP
jgi:cytochrome c oxidase assembly protein subunit 15